MELRSPHNFEPKFAQMTEDTEREIHLPDALNRELVGINAEGNILDNVVADLHEHGIPEPVLERYSAAVQAFLKDRPSIVHRSGYGLDFSPRTRYFGPNLGFPEGSQAILSALPPDFKPKLGLQKKLSVATIDGSEALLAIKKDAQQRSDTHEEAVKKQRAESGGFGQDPNKAESVVNPYDIFLTRLNRLQYAFHEPIHILQSLQSGDRLNRLQDEFDPTRTLFDEMRSADFVEDVSTPAVSAKLLELVHQAPTLPYSQSIDTPKTAREIIDTLITSNEATMDVLSERHIRAVLREQPALCLWLHNQFVSLEQASKKWLAEVQSIDKLTSVQQEVGNRLKELFGFVGQTYFTAFDSTTDAQTYFSGDLPTTIGRNVSGSIAESSQIQRTDFLNRSVEIGIRLRFVSTHKPPPPVERHIYPSGESWTFEGRRAWVKGLQIYTSPPLSHNGLEEGKELYVAAVARGADTDTLFQTFVVLQYALEQKDPELLKEARQDIEQLSGLPLTDTTIKELFGFASYLSVTSLDDSIYPKALAVRKALLDRFAERDPKRVASVYENLFFDAAHLVDFNEQRGLLGFASLAGIPTPKEGQEPIKLPTWDEISVSESLSVYGINMKVLPKEAVERVRTEFNRISAGDPTDRKAFTEAMRTLADIKRQQISETV